MLSALKANPNNEGKEFKLEFQIDSTIKGGLQMYTETEFMDMSLQSRLEKLKAEVGRFVEWTHWHLSTQANLTFLFKQE